MSYCAPTYTFIHIPKTGGNSIKRAVGKEESGHQSIEHIICDGDYFGEQPDLTKPFVTFVRNPYDRLVSAWAYSRQANLNNLPGSFAKLVKSLEHHIDKVHLEPQYMWLKTKRNIIIAIYRFESFEKDFADMQLRFGFSCNLPEGNGSDHRPYESYYTPELKKLVYQHYLADFLAFGYKK